MLFRDSGYANCSLDVIVWASCEGGLMAPGYLLQSADLSTACLTEQLGNWVLLKGN